VVSFTPRSLYPQGKSPRYPLDRRLGGPQNQSGRGVVEIIAFSFMPVQYNTYILYVKRKSNFMIFSKATYHSKVDA
jgi:hypothetical protein